MSRIFSDWIKAYIEHTQHLEAPTQFHFWTAIGTIAGALRRRVWFDMGYWKWYPNFYIILVGKPGVVKKSTSISIGMSLLRRVQGVRFGPSSITWQALVQHMSEAREDLELNGKFVPMSCVTIEASELGTLIDPHNRELLDVLVDLWDGREISWERKTKTSGSSVIENPWINILACTTPAWISQNMPEAMIGGGFASRCIFIYGGARRYSIAYPADHIPPSFHETDRMLLADLERISTLKGQFTITPDAKAFATEWYESLTSEIPTELNSERFEGYIARKQTHAHKIAMTISAAKRDTLEITLDDFKAATAVLASAEADMQKVFDKIGKTTNSVHFDQLCDIVSRHKRIRELEVIRKVLRIMTEADYEAAVALGIRAGFLRRMIYSDTTYLEWTHGAKFDA